MECSSCFMLDLLYQLDEEGRYTMELSCCVILIAFYYSAWIGRTFFCTLYHSAWMGRTFLFTLYHSAWIGRTFLCTLYCSAWIGRVFPCIIYHSAWINRIFLCIFFTVPEWARPASVHFITVPEWEGPASVHNGIVVYCYSDCFLSQCRNKQGIPFYTLFTVSIFPWGEVAQWFGCPPLTSWPVGGPRYCQGFRLSEMK